MPSSLAATRRRPARRSSRNPTNRLGAYLAAGLGATTGITATSDAAIVTIDIGPTGFNIGGVNAGLSSGGFGERPDFPFSGQGPLQFFNDFSRGGASPGFSYTYTGLGGGSGLEFAVSGVSPQKFAQYATVGAAASFSSFRKFTVFDYSSFFQTVTAPDFGSNSYMGFRTDSGNYGWLEVTWTSATNQFQILSGAYESVPNTPILAGQIVPEPSTVALGGVGALVCGGAALRRWRKQKWA
jgi:hypothetical protein